ncbi:MAG TPA: hypothetical protein VFU02_24475 [Polyangiaceae bacterium]|nr:hypothetical protein [Polyangiaceae bacterium]
MTLIRGRVYGGYMGHWARFRLRRALALTVLLLVGATLAACARWSTPRSYAVKGARDPGAAYQTVQEVVAKHDYQVIERDDAARTLEVRTHVDASTDKVTTIKLEVADDGGVTLTPAGFLVREDGTIHRRVEKELAALEAALSERLASRVPPTSASGSAAASDAPPPSASVPPAPGAPPAGTPEAWVEPASDTARWGTGNFTCLPVHIPAEDTSLIALKLSNGQIASVTLSLAYASSLCRSPAACGHSDGCPALGIGDTQQVQALAQLVGSKQVAPTATLLYKGQAAVVVDLSRHGSIAQAIGAAP